MGNAHGFIAIATGPARHWRATDMAAAYATPAWKTILGDSIGLVLVVWSIPVAILVIGTPIALVITLIIALMRSVLQS